MILLNDRTWKTSSPPPTENFDWKSRENFSSITDSVPFFSALLIFLNCMFLSGKKNEMRWDRFQRALRLPIFFVCLFFFSIERVDRVNTNRNETESCRDAFWYSIVPVLFKISPEASPLAILSFFSNVLACCSLIIDTVTCNCFHSVE